MRRAIALKRIIRIASAPERFWFAAGIAAHINVILSEAKNLGLLLSVAYQPKVRDVSLRST
jgi:hypothetical protein